ncbi:MAG: type II secretion system protein [Phycisphaerae bacterium]|nr:type II secretion system protein [Phycisphaerae bacterium]
MKKKAFTLIELLVVISIIALLVSILMPALSKAREQAKRTVCMTRMKQLVTCWQMYAMDNNDNMPGSWSNNRQGVSMFGDESDWAWAPWKLDGSGPVLPLATAKLLPMFSKEREEGIRRGSLFKYIQDPELVHCPSDKLNFRTYSMPDALNGHWGTNVITGQGDWLCFKKLSQLKRPSEKYVFIEENDSRGFNIDSWTFYTKSYVFSDPLTVWHSGGCNLAYGDGSVNWRKWSAEVTKYYKDNAWGGLVPTTQEGKEDAAYLGRGWPKP